MSGPNEQLPEGLIPTLFISHAAVSLYQLTSTIAFIYNPLIAVYFNNHFWQFSPDSQGAGNGSHSRQFVATSVYQATQARHLVVQLYHEHTNKCTNKHEGDSLPIGESYFLL